MPLDTYTKKMRRASPLSTLGGTLLLAKVLLCVVRCAVALEVVLPLGELHEELLGVVVDSLEEAGTGWVETRSAMVSSVSADDIQEATSAEISAYSYQGCFCYNRT